jgi:hypothetical protein
MNMGWRESKELGIGGDKPLGDCVQEKGVEKFFTVFNFISVRAREKTGEELVKVISRGRSEITYL